MLVEQTLLTRDHRQASLAWELASDQTSGIRRTLMDRGPEATLKRAHSTVLAREPASAKRQETIQLALLQDLEPMSKKVRVQQGEPSWVLRSVRRTLRVRVRRICLDRATMERHIRRSARLREYPSEASIRNRSVRHRGQGHTLELNPSRREQR